MDLGTFLKISNLFLLSISEEICYNIVSLSKSLAELAAAAVNQ